MKGQSYIILALIFALIVAIFAVINVEPVEVDYLFGTGNAPLILVILISVLMGGLITAAVGWVKVLRLQKEVRSLKKKNEQLDEPVAEPASMEESTEQDQKEAMSNHKE
ncbi:MULTISPECIES: lipopolysaccharide assembly LapA domain-containing protein [Sediminibacillus]|uniref:LapA family protein n=1 Tax=Sediminibacillus TaxID=482460 RepID=UPI001297C43B|nr:lipopolysaccharide assembly protein LapA domain-containing protein [Sediminibacillus terrae]